MNEARRAEIVSTLRAVPKLWHQVRELLAVRVCTDGGGSRSGSAASLFSTRVFVCFFVPAGQHSELGASVTSDTLHSCLIVPAVNHGEEEEEDDDDEGELSYFGFC